MAKNYNYTLLKPFLNKHFFTDATNIFPVIFKIAVGNYLYDVNNKKYIDLFSGMGVSFLGHNNKTFIPLLIKQLKTISISNYFPTTIKLEFLKDIQYILPKNMLCLTLFSTGAEAVEYSFRLARVISKKTNFISFSKSLHGKTHAAANASWNHPSYGNFHLGFYRFKYPCCDHCNLSNKTCNLYCFKKFKNKFHKLPLKNIGAIIIEQIQGYSGGIIPPKIFFKKVISLCKNNKILLIYDEILTGLGRTGKLFSYQHFSNTTPDILIIGKALGNGFPISAVITKQSYLKKAGFALPGSTYSGNPLACASASAVLKYIKKNNPVKKAVILEKVIKETLKPLLNNNHISFIRGFGAFFVIEFKNTNFLKMLYPKFLQAGIAITSVENCLRILPPITIKTEDLKKALEKIVYIINNE